MRKLIAIDIQPEGLRDTLGRSIAITKLEDILDFIMIDTKDSFIVVWNLYQLVDLISHFIPEAKYLELLERDKVWVNDYKLFSSAGKKLSIGHEYKTLLHDNFYESTKKEVDIYNLNRYFPDYRPIDLNDIYGKGIELLTALDEMGMGNTPTLASAIAIYSKTVLDHTTIPHLYDMPDEALDALEYVTPLLSREWRAVHQIGCWQKGTDREATDIDLRSAYPSLVSNFGDLSDCKIWHAKKYEPCDWGIFKGKVTIFGDSPIVNKDKQPVKGTYPDSLTTDQWAYLNKYKRGHFEPEDGWLFKYARLEQPIDKPFYEIMKTLYEQRQGGGFKSDFAKSIAVGLIGQLAQTYENKHGEHYNPFYNVMATSRCSLKVGRFIEDNALWDHLISVIVDGLLIDEHMFIPDTGKMGSWHGDVVNALVLSIHHSYVGTKHPDNRSFEDMMAAIKTKPNMGAFNNVTLIEEMHTSNRQFDSFPKTGEEWINNIYKSKPIEVK